MADGMATTVVVAEGEVLARVTEAMAATAEDGLSAPAAATFGRALSRTPWALQHQQCLVLTDNVAPAVAATLRAGAWRYRFTGVLDEKPVRICGIGSIWAAPGQDADGQRQILMDRLIAEAEGDGTDLILLCPATPTAPIPPGFTRLPTTDVTLTVIESTRRGAPMTLVRGGEDRDLAAIVAMDAARASQYRFHLDRDEALTRHAMTRLRLRAGLAPDGTRQLRFVIAEEGITAAAYLLISVTNEAPGPVSPGDGPTSGPASAGDVPARGPVSPGDAPTRGPVWTIDACGDRDPSGARVGALLQALVAIEPSRHRPRIHGWLPPGFQPPQITITAREPSREVVLVRDLRTAAAAPLVEQDVLFWRADLF